MTTEPKFQRASDTILKWALGLVGAGIIATIGLLLDIRVSLAVYQADAKAMKERLDKIEAWESQHDIEDRARFKQVGISR